MKASTNWSNVGQTSALSPFSLSSSPTQSRPLLHRIASPSNPALVAHCSWVLGKTGKRRLWISMSLLHLGAWALQACVVSVLIRCLHREHVCNINIFRVKPEQNGSSASFPLLMIPPSSSSLPTLCAPWQLVPLLGQMNWVREECPCLPCTRGFNLVIHSFEGLLRLSTGLSCSFLCALGAFS